MLLPKRKNFSPERRGYWCVPLMIFGCLSALNAPQAFGITDCRGIVTDSDYKIAVDDVTTPGTGAAPASTDIQRLTAELQTQIKESPSRKVARSSRFPVLGAARRAKRISTGLLSRR